MNFLEARSKIKYQIQCECCSSSPWQSQNHDYIKLTKRTSPRLQNWSSIISLLLNSNFFQDFSSFFSVSKLDKKITLKWKFIFIWFPRFHWNFPSKKVRCKFFEGIPFWLHKILLSGLLKNYKETPKKTIFFWGWSGMWRLFGVD